MLPLLYHAHHRHYQEDIPFWLGLSAQAGSPVLELGCGTGRVLIRLAQAGFHAVGIDKDLPMLNFLQALLESDAQHAPALIAADITRFGMKEKFPLVILPCNTFSTMNPNERISCLGSTSGCLCRAGLFAVSLPNPSIFHSLPDHSEAELEDEFLHPITGNPVQVSSAWQRTKYTFEVRWIYDHLLPNGEVEHVVVKTVHYKEELGAYLDEIQHAGLSVIETYGDFDRSEYTGDSPELIILATKS